MAVNVGYRLAPKNAYPTHLMDIKRALRWLKKNIASFGGDPNYIILSGMFLDLVSYSNLIETFR